jgi:Mrp family chromosome partitioning ATPase
LRRGFSVDRAGLSNVVQIQYTARDPDQAARVANEFVRAYSADQNAARLDAAQSGSSWLRERLREVGPKARVIAEALPPQHKSNVRGVLIIAVAGGVGGVVAAASAILWRFLDPRIVTPEEAIAVTGAQFLGIIPKLPSYSKKSDFKSKDGGEGEADGQNGYFCAHSSPLSYALDHQLSEPWRTLQNVEAACRDRLDGKGTRFIGVTSTFAREGRSVVASNLALFLASSSKRVLLIDSDLHCRTLTRGFSCEDRPGLIEALRNDKDSFAKHLITENRTNLDFLPIGQFRNGQAVSIWTDGMRRLFDEAEKVYHYVIFDLPSFGDAGDIRSAAHFIDGFLLVIGWGMTTPDCVKAGMAATGISADRIIGTVLNNVDPVKSRWLLSPQLAFARMQRSADVPKTG